MADYLGTTARDRIVGTNGDDVITAVGNDAAGYGPGNADVLIGRDGADSYVLTWGTRFATGGYYNKNFVIDDRGTDGALDTITVPNGMWNTTSTGSRDEFASVRRAGDSLVINLPGANGWWRHNATPDVNITIRGQYSGTGVEQLTTGTGTYNLITGDTGTAQADIIAGDSANDVFDALGGDDFVFSAGGMDTLTLGDGDDYADAGGGRDIVYAGAGNDRVFGGNGADRVYGGDGNDLVDGGAHNDRIWGEAGNDTLRGAEGNDRIWGQQGDDRLEGGNGDDRLYGGGGNDRLDGGNGSDLMVGGRGGDSYTITGEAGDVNIIRDNGSAASYTNMDTLDASAISMTNASNTALLATPDIWDALSFERVGNDMVVTQTETGAVTIIEDMLNVDMHDKAFIELLQTSIYTFYISDGAVTNFANDRDWTGGLGADVSEVLIGTDGDDEIYGGTGVNYIHSGDGADVFIYKAGDGQSNGMGGGIISHDVIGDFDLANDVIDFSEVTGEFGLDGYYIQMTEQADGDTQLFARLGDFQTADVMIELQGISLADFQAADVLIY